jgi:hypothetical protein
MDYEPEARIIMIPDCKHPKGKIGNTTGRCCAGTRTSRPRHGARMTSFEFACVIHGVRLAEIDDLISRRATAKAPAAKELQQRSAEGFRGSQAKQGCVPAACSVAILIAEARQASAHEERRARRV